jgi:hypothetical protein
MSRVRVRRFACDCTSTRDAKRSNAGGESCEKRAREDRARIRARSNLRARQDQLALCPPSTLRTWPVINLASSEPMNTMPSATSSESPSRPSGTCVAKAALFSDVPVKRVSDGIHANARLGDFKRHRLGNALDSVLGADVDRRFGQ